jgi:hypothetical protein
VALLSTSNIEDDPEVECAPPGVTDAPLVLVSRVSSVGPTTNGNGGKTRVSVAVSSFRPYIGPIEAAISVGLLFMSNMVTENLSLHDTLSDLLLVEGEWKELPVLRVLADT